MSSSIAENTPVSHKKSEENETETHAQIETDVQQLLSDMQNSFKSYQERMFEKSKCIYNLIFIYTHLIKFN